MKTRILNNNNIYFLIISHAKLTAQLYKHSTPINYENINLSKLLKLVNVNIAQCHRLSTQPTDATIMVSKCAQSA